jgi:hypothetical protein
MRQGTFTAVKVYVMSFKHPIGERNKNKIINSITKMGKDVTPTHIKKHIDEEALVIVRRRYPFEMFSKDKHKEELDKETMSLTAVKTNLKDLCGLGLVINLNGRYSIHDKMRSDIRYFASQFGSEALAYTMSMHFPTIATLEQNLDELIEIFGSYVLYSFIEAGRPVIDEHMTNADKDKLSSGWIQNVFAPLDMYDYFLTVFKNKALISHKNTLRETGSSRSKRFPPSTHELAENRFLSLQENSIHIKMENHQFMS